MQVLGRNHGLTVRRLALAGLIATALAGAMSGCSAGQVAQTAAKVPSVGGANANVGAIALRDLVVAYPGPDHGGYPAAGTAPLQVRIFNSGTTEDQLVEVTSTAGTVVLLSQPPVSAAPANPSISPTPSTSASNPEASPSGSAASPSVAEPSASPSASAPAGSTAIKVAVPAQGYRLLLPGQGAYLAIRGLTRPIAPGESVTVTFRFAKAGPVTVQIPTGIPLSPLPRSPMDIHPGGEHK